MKENRCFVAMKMYEANVLRCRKSRFTEDLSRRWNCRGEDSRVVDVFFRFFIGIGLSQICYHFFCFRCKIRFVNALLLSSVVFFFSNVERCENRKGRGRLLFANALNLAELSIYRPSDFADFRFVVAAEIILMTTNLYAHCFCHYRFLVVLWYRLCHRVLGMYRRF